MPKRIKRLSSALAVGSAAFIESLRRRVLKDKGQNTNERQWRRLLPFSDIVAAVEKVKDEPWDDFAGRYGDWGRNLAIYIGRRRSGLTLREIGEQIGMKIKAVSQGASRIEKRFEHDGLLREQYRQALELLGEQDQM